MKRGAPLTRKTPLRRTRMRKAPTKPRKGADPAYVAWVHTQACVLDHQCEGRIEQSHGRNLVGLTGTGRKEKDRNSVPMCTKAHREWEARDGFFRYWSRDARREWMIGWISRANEAFDRERGAA